MDEYTIILKISVDETKVISKMQNLLKKSVVTAIENIGDGATIDVEEIIVNSNRQ